MRTMKVEERQHRWDDGGSTLSAVIRLGDASHRIWFRAGEGPLATVSDAFLAAGLIPAMVAADALHLADPISLRLLSAVRVIQDIFHSWYKFPRIHLEAQPRLSLQQDSSRGVGCFFSGGVDSFYSVLKHREEITKLIFVHGFDLAVRDTALLSKISRMLQQAAAQLGKPLIEVQTNIQELFGYYALQWGKHTHGAAMAAVAHLLSPQLKKVYVPATHSYVDLHPWGSHPLLDPLWSTEEIDIVHDGCEATRPEKTATIAASDTALRYLRVCWQLDERASWEGREGIYNCGRCEKCVRTMVALRLAGALERCPTFDCGLDLARVAATTPKDSPARRFVQENLNAAERSGADPELVDALRRCLDGAS